LEKIMNVGKSVLMSVVSCALAGASMVSCATAPAYNPQTPQSGPSARVAAICQNVMGLSPTERLTGGNWLGNDKLDYWTSHYRGCIVSLSDSLQNARDAEVSRQAADRCRAQGLLPGSPDLALCVLKTANEHPEPSESSAAAATQTAVSENLTAQGSYYQASPHETARREQVACAALGLSPAEPEFKSCVQELSATFYSIDHPI
jgi:hypothetical protein